LRTHVGVYAFWHKLFADANDARLHAAYGGNHWYSLRLADSLTVPDGHGRFTLLAGASHRGDYRFQGIGSDADSDVVDLRYRANRFEGGLSFDRELLGSRFHAYSGARRVAFKYGFADPYSIYHHGLEIAWDSRDAQLTSVNGFNLALKGGQAFDLVERDGATSWVTYGATVGIYTSLLRKNRVLALLASTEQTDPTRAAGTIPFTELVTAGELMPAFGPGTLLGRSNAVFRLEYRWPIWAFLDAETHFAVGNVFDQHLENFRWDRMRMSFGVGARTTDSGDLALQVLAAFGTDTFAQGANLTAFRLLMGSTIEF
jgi:hypothetical protein